jgi:hypothetical protein
MVKRIFFIDEDIAGYRAWLAELELSGYVVEPMRTADEAFERLWDIGRDDVALVVVDVLLAVEDLASTRFSEERTKNYLETGLRLLEDLVEQNPVVFPRRAVLLSGSTSHDTVASVRRTCKEHGIPFWRKAEIMSPLDLSDRITDRLRELDDEDNA